jgi:hypothetical protein
MLFSFLPEFSTLYGQPSKISHILVKITLHYKLEGHTFNSQRCHWYILMTLHCGLGVNSASSKNVYLEYFVGGGGGGGKGSRCIGLTGLPPSWVNCYEIWEPRPPGTKGLSRPVLGMLYLYLYLMNITVSLSHKNLRSLVSTLSHGATVHTVGLY